MSTTTEPKKKYNPLILELIDQRDSSFIRVGTEHMPKPDRLRVSSDYLMLNSGYIISEEDESRIPTRWIQGETSIIVEEQKKKNQEYKSNRDVINFQFGILEVRRSGLHIGLYDFLKKHPRNASNPKRDKNVEPLFKEFDTAQEAAKFNFNISDEAEATTYVSGLQTKKKGPGDTHVFEYDTEMIQWLIDLFKLEAGPSDEEKLAAVWIRAKNNPITFNQLISDARSDYKVLILQGVKTGILKVDGDTAIFSSDMKVMKKFIAKKHEEKIEELTDYIGLITSTGDKLRLQNELESYKLKQENQ